MQRMIKAARAAVLIGALAVPGLASAAACVSGSLSSYLGLSDCTVGVLTLDGFSLFALPAGATAIDTDLISVTPVAKLGAAGLSLTLSDGLDAQSGDLFELLFGFRATPIGRSIADNTLRLLGATAVVSDGVITGVQDLCAGATIAADLSCAGTPFTSIVFDDGTDSEIVSTTPLGASAPIGVLLDLAVDGGGAGSASLGAGGGLSTEFSIRAVPEPSTLLAGLLGLSLAAGCSWRRPARPSRNL